MRCVDIKIKFSFNIYIVCISSLALAHFNQELKSGKHSSINYVYEQNSQYTLNQKNLIAELS